MDNGAPLIEQYLKDFETLDKFTKIIRIPIFVIIYLIILSILIIIHLKISNTLGELMNTWFLEFLMQVAYAIYIVGVGIIVFHFDLWMFKGYNDRIWARFYVNDHTFRSWCKMKQYDLFSANFDAYLIWNKEYSQEVNKEADEFTKWVKRKGYYDKPEVDISSKEIYDEFLVEYKGMKS